jgi:hypothetical protein
MRLLTLAEYQRLTPRQQGYVQYAQGAWPGSELCDLSNPYSLGTKEYEEWVIGQQVACEQAQDSEE